MSINFSKIQNYQVGYTNREEFKLLKEEIFDKGIYDIKLNKTNPVIFDLGAHIGLSILFFKSKYPDSQIVAFEPNPNIFPILEENILYNKIENVELHNTALGNNDGIKDFYIDCTGNDCFSTASFTPQAWNGKQITTTIKVKTEKLSKYINTNIDILKIDTEGSELEIIKEVEKAGKLSLIKNVIIEFHPIKNRNPKKITDILNKNNFDTDIRLDPLGSNLIDILGKNRT